MGGMCRPAAWHSRTRGPRWLRVLLLAAFVLGSCLPALGGCGTKENAPSPTPGPPAAAGPGAPAGTRSPSAEPAEQPSAAAKGARIPVIAATVTGVTDGDTFRARLANGREEKVRLIGVDAPESTTQVEPYGREAAAYSKKRLSGRTVCLELDVGERDKYGRLLAYVWLSRPQSASAAEVRAKMFNAELLLAGMAQVVTVPPNVKYADLFSRLAQEARAAGKGLWGAGGVVPTAGSGAAAPARFIGNASSKRFHRPDCEWAAAIAPRNRVPFATRNAATAAGYTPCKACRP